jgi:hypothetical protein
MEKNEQNFLNAIEKEYNSFNRIELPPSINEEIERCYKDAKETSNEKELLSCFDWMYSRRKDFQKHNLRYVNFKSVDRFKKYTPFYKLIRQLYEEANPNIFVDYSKNPWQLIDMAIVQLEADLNDTIKGNVDLFWYKKFNKIYDDNEPYWTDYADDFVKLLNLVYNVGDYFIVEVHEKLYFTGFCNESPELNDQVYISRKSNQKERTLYRDMYLKFSNDLTGIISDKMKEIGKLITTKFSAKEFRSVLELEEFVQPQINKWFLLFVERNL